MYDVYTQLALRDHFVKQALYNQLVQNALIKYARDESTLLGAFLRNDPKATEKLVQQLRGEGGIIIGEGKGKTNLLQKMWNPLSRWGSASGKYLADLVKAHPWRAGGIGAGALLGLGGAGYGLSRLLSSSPVPPPVPEPSVLDTLYGLAPGAGIGALAGAGLGGLGTLAAGGREARKEAIRNALIGALMLV